MNPQNQCAHPGCKCSVPQDRAQRNNRFCSDACEQHSAASGQKAQPCTCGHPACASAH